MGKTRKLSRGSRKHGKKLVGKRMEKRMEKKNVKYGKKRTYRRRKLMGKKWGGVKVTSVDGTKIEVTSSDNGKTLIVNGLNFNFEATSDGYYGYKLSDKDIWIQYKSGENWKWLDENDAKFLCCSNINIGMPSAIIAFTDSDGNTVSLPDALKTVQKSVPNCEDLKKKIASIESSKEIPITERNRDTTYLTMGINNDKNKQLQKLQEQFINAQC